MVVVAVIVGLGGFVAVVVNVAVSVVVAVGGTAGPNISFRSQPDTAMPSVKTYTNASFVLVFMISILFSLSHTLVIDARFRANGACTPTLPPGGQRPPARE